ncbi:hypothetical protein TIFTF001_045185 [Ficus carica]|uniref:Uncharacterized protein n=1 Tax=Ficus carica TaxID=3494 RepID=A0AA87Z5T7_FICCA|nr:hypothetical protein TIFTF001_045185 [Ficus carica]
MLLITTVIPLVRNVGEGTRKIAVLEPVAAFYRGQGSQLHAAQMKLEGPAISQGRLEASEPQGRIYAYTKEDVQAGPSTVVTGQLHFAQQDAYLLIDSRATHSFTSPRFAKKLGRASDRIGRTFRTALPSGEILLSDYWIRHIPIIICGREMYVNLIIIDLYDYDVILGMDFLGKYNAKDVWDF